MTFGIRARFALSITLLITVFSSVVSGVFMLQTRSAHLEMLEASQSASARALMDEARAQNKAMVQLIAEQLINPLYFNELEIVANFTASALDQEGVIYIYVFDASGRIIHDGTETLEAFGEVLDDPAFHLALNEKRQVSITQGPILHTTAPVLVGSKVLGGVRVGHSLSAIHAAVADIEGELTNISESNTDTLINSILLLMVVLAGAGIVTGLMAFGGVAKAIVTLTEATREIGQGRYEAGFMGVPRKRNDELGELIASVAQMSQSLASSEAKLREALEWAQSANQAKSKFLSSMSHELRTPLNAILGFGQVLLLRKDRLTEDQVKAVQHILRGGELLLGLIDEVLDMASIEAGEIKLSIEPVDPFAVAHQCLLMVGSMADKYGVEVKANSNGADLPAIDTDAMRLKQVLLNLLSNAIKYNRSNGLVTLSYQETEDGMLRINVTDTGEGIPEDSQERVFTPFERMGREASNIEGTGIGLTITKELVELMQGRIGLQSEVGKGSTFWVEFPIAGEQSAEESGTA